MTTATTTRASTPATSELIEAYQRDGFVKVQSILTREQANEFAPIALAASDRMKKLDYARERNIFDQSVNAWREDPGMRRLTLNPHIAACAEALTGKRMRLWHDQILIKRPGKSAPTDFHQDQPYWPHVLPSTAISCWIALVDVPAERGCMTFIPGFQERDDLGAKNLIGGATMFDICPEMTWAPRITLPLRAGDCTFHSGRTPHMANANSTDQPRVAHVIIFIEEGTRFSGGNHVVTEGLGLNKGDVLDHELFPLTRDFARLSTGG